MLDVVIWHEHHAMSPDEIVAQYPSLTLADVHLALAYYFDNIEEIRAEMRSEATLADSYSGAHPSLIGARLDEAS